MTATIHRGPLPDGIRDAGMARRLEHEIIRVSQRDIDMADERDLAELIRWVPSRNENATVEVLEVRGLFHAYEVRIRRLRPVITALPEVKVWVGPPTSDAFDAIAYAVRAYMPNIIQPGLFHLPQTY